VNVRRIPRFFWLLVATLLIAAFLRLWQLDTLPPGLHYDEAADTIIAQQIARGESAPIFVAAYTGKEVLFFYWAAAPKLIGPSVCDAAGGGAAGRVDGRGDVPGGGGSCATCTCGQMQDAGAKSLCWPRFFATSFCTSS
jgi:hypothetical protein